MGGFLDVGQSFRDDEVGLPVQLLEDAGHVAGAGTARAATFPPDSTP
jgi:hypothetical protein